MKKKKLLLFFISFFLFIPLASASDYKIEKYDVNINVNENHVLNVEENIDVKFNYSFKHGIIRNIPIKNTYYRIIDGKYISTNEKTKIKNIKVNNKYTKTIENGYVNLKIGDPNKTLDTETIYNYKITYDYDMGDDLIDEYDDLYFNIIGDKWDTSIKDVSFTIKMPKDFDQTKINFTTGKFGSTYNDNVIYDINNNVITGSLTKKYDDDISLYSYEGLTVRIELEEGYYKNERKNFDFTRELLYLLLVITCSLIILSLYLYIKYGYKEKDVIVVEYSPFKDLTPAEVGYIYKGRIDKKHIISLITYFANKGYLEIIDDKKSFKLKKIKDISASEPEYAAVTFRGLFSYADKEGIVKSSSLNEKFYTTLERALNKLKKSQKIYDQSHYVIKTLYIIIPFITLTLFGIFKMFYSYKVYLDYNSLYGLNKKIIIFSFIYYLILFIISKKRNKDNYEYYNKIKGFREFINTVEKEKLEEMVEQNHSLFYDILQY